MWSRYVIIILVLLLVDETFSKRSGGGGGRGGGGRGGGWGGRGGGRGGGGGKGRGGGRGGGWGRGSGWGRGGRAPAGRYGGYGGFRGGTGPGSVSNGNSFRNSFLGGFAGAFGGMLAFEAGKAIIQSLTTPFQYDNRNYYFDKHPRIRGDQIQCTMPIKELMELSDGSTHKKMLRIKREEANTTSSFANPNPANTMIAVAVTTLAGGTILLPKTTFAPLNLNQPTTVAPDQVLNTLQYKNGTRPKEMTWACRRDKEACCGVECCPLEDEGFLGSAFSLGIIIAIVAGIGLLLCCAYFLCKNGGFKNGARRDQDESGYGSPYPHDVYYNQDQDEPPPQGYPYPYPSQGYPPQGNAPYGGYPPYGYPPDGYPPYGYPPGAYPPYGYPPDGDPDYPQRTPPEGGYPPRFTRGHRQSRSQKSSGRSSKKSEGSEKRTEGKQGSKESTEEKPKKIGVKYEKSKAKSIAKDQKSEEK